MELWKSSAWLFGSGCFFWLSSFGRGKQVIWSSAKAIELSSGKAQLGHLVLVVSSALVALVTETNLFGAQLLDLDVCFFCSWLFGGGCFFCA